jgi:AcrR family transcriptional regulator
MCTPVNLSGVNLSWMCTGVNIQVMAQAKRGYHHGDLRNALIKAAAQLAEQGGPRAVTVRAAARTVGVTPTAAYRHFENHEQLIAAAKEEALDQLARTMRRFTDRLPEVSDPARRAMTALAAIARGYIHFATHEPGLFRTAFEQGGSAFDGGALAKVDLAFRMLVDGLDELVETGHISAAQRKLTEITCWSTVHGFSMLVIDGPMHGVPDEVIEEAIEQMIALLVRGLSANVDVDELTAQVIADTKPLAD